MNKPMNNKSTETSPKNMIETGDRFEEEVMYAAPGLDIFLSATSKNFDTQIDTHCTRKTA